jgi:hypothetical protein
MATKNEEEVVMCLDIKRDGNDISSLMKKRNKNSNEDTTIPLERVLVIEVSKKTWN